jgi:hypothetical protein
MTLKLGGVFVRRDSDAQVREYFRLNPESPWDTAIAQIAEAKV